MTFYLPNKNYGLKGIKLPPIECKPSYATLY